MGVEVEWRNCYPGDTLIRAIYWVITGDHMKTSPARGATIWKIGALVIVWIEELRSIRTIAEIVKKTCQRSYRDHSKMIGAKEIYSIIHHFSQSSTHPIEAMISFRRQRTHGRISRPLCGGQWIRNCVKRFLGRLEWSKRSGPLYGNRAYQGCYFCFALFCFFLFGYFTYTSFWWLLKSRPS